jgi:hypothetical protein
MQEIPAHWLSALDDVLAQFSEGADDSMDRATLTRLTVLDPDLLAFLVAQIAEQDSPQAASALEALTRQPETPQTIQEQARAGLEAMAERGVMPDVMGAERFMAGWVQQARERGEQILMLCWRLAQGDLEAMVFLLDWRGDGLKDYYRTRRMKHDEWAQLVEHNRAKGAPLVEIEKEQARTLLAASLAESRRFSRSLPRDYTLEASLIERRLELSHIQQADPPSHVSVALAPEEVVAAYIAALHYRDFLLVAMLLDDAHPLRAGHTRSETADELRRHYKGASRRERDAIANQIESGDDHAIVEAQGTQVVVEKTGRKVREAVRERYTLKLSGTWRIVSVS